MPLSKFWKDLEEFLMRKGLHEPVISNHRLQEKMDAKDLGLSAELAYSI